jgi:hypothetical protein
MLQISGLIVMIVYVSEMNISNVIDIRKQSLCNTTADCLIIIQHCQEYLLC